MLPDWTRTCHVPYVKKNLISVLRANKLLMTTKSLANLTHAHHKLEKTADIWRRHYWFPHKMTSEKWAQKFHTDDVHYQDLGSTFDWLKRISHAARPIRRTTRIWVVNVIRMGFLRLFLRRHFAGKLVLASWNVGCFLRLARSAPTLFSVGESCRWWL